MREAKRRFDRQLLKWHPWPIVAAAALTAAFCIVGFFVSRRPVFDGLVVVWICLAAMGAFTLLTDNDSA